MTRGVFQGSLVFFLVKPSVAMVLQQRRVHAGGRNCIDVPYDVPFCQDDGKGGLSLRGVAITTETATTAETAKTVKTVTVVSWHYIL